MSLGSFEDDEKEGVICFSIWVVCITCKRREGVKKVRTLLWFVAGKMKKMENAMLGSYIVLSQVVGPIGTIVSRA